MNFVMKPKAPLFLVYQDSSLCSPFNVTFIIFFFFISKTFIFESFVTAGWKLFRIAQHTYWGLSYKKYYHWPRPKLWLMRYISAVQKYYSHMTFSEKIWLFVKSASDISQSVGTTWIGKKSNKSQETNSWPRILI